MTSINFKVSILSLTRQGLENARSRFQLGTFGIPDLSKREVGVLLIRLPGLVPCPDPPIHTPYRPPPRYRYPVRADYAGQPRKVA